jgi:hypothetical protein
MRTKTGFSIRKICGENIIVADGVENIDFCNVISMNESSTYLWNAINGKEFTYNDLTKLLLDRYEVEEEQASKDAIEVVEQWKKADIMEKD